MSRAGGGGERWQQRSGGRPQLLGGMDSAATPAVTWEAACGVREKGWRAAQDARERGVGARALGLEGGRTSCSRCGETGKTVGNVSDRLQGRSLAGLARRAGRAHEGALHALAASICASVLHPDRPAAPEEFHGRHSPRAARISPAANTAAVRCAPVQAKLNAGLGLRVQAPARSPGFRRRCHRRRRRCLRQSACVPHARQLTRHCPVHPPCGSPQPP